MPKKRIEKPAEAPQKPIASDKPLIDRAEQKRADDSLRPYKLTEEERLAIIAKYGAPTRPYKPGDGKEIMHMPKPAKDPRKTRKRA